MNEWIKELLNQLDKIADDDQCREIMEACGEKCPFTHLGDEKLLEIKEQSVSDRDFIEQMARQWRVKIENDGIFVVFDRCYCPLINDDIKGASKTLCYCTMGNIKKKFRLGLGREIKVVMEKTILAGDNECRFKVLL